MARVRYILNKERSHHFWTELANSGHGVLCRHRPAIT
jgi:hypothetical protein